MMDAAASAEKGQEIQTEKWSERHDQRIRAATREKCAKIARRCRDDAQSRNYHAEAIALAIEIESAIRAGGGQ
jgi:hypothetical protein